MTMLSQTRKESGSSPLQKRCYKYICIFAPRVSFKHAVLQKVRFISLFCKKCDFSGYGKLESSKWPFLVCGCGVSGCVGGGG